jgi:nucleoside-diphosphate-sugar epimerase
MTVEAHGNFSGKRLVIFGCGYVGSELARAGVARGLRVTALTRNAAQAAALRAGGIEVVVADLAGDDWHGRIEGGAEFAVNCVSSGGAGLAGYRRSYVDGMASIVRWANGSRPVGTLVYTGSTSVYPQDGGVRVDECAPTDAAPERGRILLEAEEELRSSVGACERWFVLRLAGIYGPGRHGLLDQVRTGEIAGHGEHRLNLIYRDDICTAVWRALGAPATVANEIFNVADDGAARKAEVVGWLAAKLGVPAPHFSGAPPGGRRAAAPDRIVVNEKLKARLGWRPDCPTFREGYEKILSRS